MMYKTVAQAVILYGSEIWVVTDKMMTVLEGLLHSINRRVVGMTSRKGDGKEWEWASVDASLETTGVWLIREYMRRRKENIT